MASSLQSTDNVTLRLGTLGKLLLLVTHFFGKLEGKDEAISELHGVLAAHGTDVTSVKDAVAEIGKVAGAALPDDLTDHVFGIIDAHLVTSQPATPPPDPGTPRGAPISAPGTGLGLDRPTMPPPGTPTSTPPSPTSRVPAVPPGTFPYRAPAPVPQAGTYTPLGQTQAGDGFTRTAPPAHPIATHPVATGVTGGATAEGVAATARADADASQTESPADVAARTADQVQQQEQ